MPMFSIDDQLDGGTIVGAARRQLRASPYFFLRSIDCGYESGVLTLRGRVPLEPLKEFAELIVSRVEGVRQIVNRIEVCDPQRTSAY